MSPKFGFTAAIVCCVWLTTGAWAQSKPPSTGEQPAPITKPSSPPTGGSAGNTFDCPVQGAEAIEKATLAAPTCTASVRVLKACAFGTTADVQLAQKVINKCEARFSRRISKQRYRAYRAALARCTARYGRMQGSMYQSLAAICRAEAAARTARIARRR